MKRTYAHLEQVITFYRDTPKIGWAVDPGGRAAGTTLERDGKQQVRVATHREDAEDKRYTVVSSNDVYPWTEELWNACQLWLEKGKEMEAMYAQLKRGKIPKELAAYKQVDLFGQSTGSS